ncbi:MAG: decapping endonuclease targeting mRNA [Claussenomyces sp. TS43310]|nr:MAG: decapping endonuclease targeting mRNA [Claussenomyces sp. TS43310]
MTSSRFEIQPIGKWHGVSAAIKRPREIAYFSYDDKHQFRLDESSLRYYYPPQLGADLCRGFDTFEKLDDTADDHLDSLLKTIVAHEQETGQKVDAEIITWRGMMTKIMGTPFGDRDGFIEEDHAYKLASHARQSSQVSQPGRPSQDMMSFWGRRDAQSDIPVLIVSRDYIENRGNEVVNNYSQYCSVVRTGIGSTAIILGGEVDAVWDAKPSIPGMPIKWVELKTSVDPRSDRDMLSFERKLMKFWIQSFLLGVPKIIVGFRDPNGILLRTEEMETASIPNTVKRRGKGSWDGNMCINFTAGFLEFLKKTIIGDGVWRIRRRERSPFIEVFRIEETGHGDILTDEFINWRIKLVLDSSPVQESKS